MDRSFHIISALKSLHCTAMLSLNWIETADLGKMNRFSGLVTIMQMADTR